ncbi:MAG: MoaD/ThiS family protein [Pirellulales bacterium]
MNSSQTAKPSEAFLRVQLFAGVAETAGTRLLELPWHGGTALDLKNLLVRTVPAAANLVATSTIAVNNQYVQDTMTIDRTADVSVIPPVSGG